MSTGAQREDAFRRPVVVLTVPRSGSSMVAGCLAALGVWTGETVGPCPWNARGFYENTQLVKLLRDSFAPYDATSEAVVAQSHAEWAPSVRRALDAEGWSGELWMMKHAAIYWPLWLRDFRPYWVLVRRPWVEMLQSGARTWLREHSAEKLAKVLAVYEREMAIVRDVHGGIEIDSGRLIRGDFAELEALAERLGLDFDSDKVAAVVEPKLWRDWDGDWSLR